MASQIHSAFHNEPNSIRKFCPPCWEKRDAANSYIYFATYLALGLVGFVLALVLTAFVAVSTTDTLSELKLAA